MLFRFRHFVTRLSVLRNPVLVLWRSSRVDVKLQAAIPVWVDAVEKVFSGWRTKFFSPAGGSHAGQREGPHRISAKRSQTFVHVLQRLAATETTKTQPLRDFRSSSIFDFFDSIGHFLFRQHRSFSEVRARIADFRSSPDNGHQASEAVTSDKCHNRTHALQ